MILRFSFFICYRTQIFMNLSTITLYLFFFITFAPKSYKINMSRNRKPLPTLQNVTITDIAAEGKSLAKVDDMVVFVPFTVPGDIVNLQIRKKKHHYCEAEVTSIIKYSNCRATTFCNHFGIYGGCNWHNLPYEEHIKAKQKQVHDQLSRIGKIKLPEFHPILGS